MLLTFKVGSMFAGIGGTCLGFKQAGADIVWANEMDKNACITYRENFGEDYLKEGNILEVDKTAIPKLDILIGGFPCQAFSIAGYRKGFEDERGNVFFQIIEVLKAQEKVHGELPKAIMLENVKNLKSHDKGNTYKIIKEALEAFGYTVKSEILNSMEHGNVPQNRERIFIVGFQDAGQAERFEFPDKIPLTNHLNNIIDRNNKLEDKYYYTDASQYYPMLQEAMHNTETTYQLRRVYVRENRRNVAPTLTANMGTGGHNVPLILDYQNNIRKLTPEECLLLQGFPKDFTFPAKMANGPKYKQAGNSVTVPVIKRVATNIIKVLDKEKVMSNIDF
ncbi:DNA cytosine methyltransferase [Bacillus altitudinis]|uniref:DNA cytosine methyltransferase n=1 Tax=Bacillus altitudinis TaxID=293387 RepID=UPI00203B6A47|nr:DNA cytosine methyltransferase [Bacillus altitudinis]MCM3045238.1 DNA cytosine methyltransferase [Bacillus altitudinis]MEC1801798.1 DNA cytosine methyltransferase [Bacillus altitudinis]MED0682419.1 DNA cytosine methyltransferase [Bacillus altitudinis]